MSVRLDPLCVEDAVVMACVLAAPGLYAVTGGGPPTVAELTDRYRRQVRGRSEDGTEEWFNWVVRLDGSAVGYVQATVYDGPRAELAWVIGEPWQGRGLATEAARDAIALLRARRVSLFQAHIAPGHLPSERVAARVGLAPTGRLDADGEQLWVG